MSDMSLLPVGSGMGSDALAAAGGAFVGATGLVMVLVAMVGVVVAGILLKLLL